MVSLPHLKKSSIAILKMRVTGEKYTNVNNGHSYINGLKLVTNCSLNIRYITFNSCLNTSTATKKEKCNENLYFHLFLLFEELQNDLSSR